MADDEDQNEEVGGEGEEGEGEEGEKVGGKKKLLIIIIVVLLLVGGGAGVFLSGMLGGGDEAETTEEHSEEGGDHGDGHAKEGEDKEAMGPSYYELPDFIVNLNSGSKRTSFLKMKVTLEVEGGPEAIGHIEANKPRIMDAFNTYLRELRTSDLSGSAGIYRLREELLLRVNKAIEPEQVKDILFNELIVQ